MTITPTHYIDDVKFDEPYENIIGTGALLKKVIKHGNGIRPVDNDVIKISLNYHGLEGSYSEEMTFVLGFLLNIEGIELACKFMEVGEVAVFKIKSHLAYGEIGLSDSSYNIPAYHDLIVQIHLISVEQHQKSLLTASTNHILDDCQVFRKRGKFYFKREEFDRAIFVYNKVLDILTHITNNRSDKLLSMEMSIFQNNLATCYYKMNSLKKALEMSTDAIFFDPKNATAFYKHLIILEALKEYDNAILCIKKGMVDLPSENEVLEKRLIQFMVHKRKVDDKERGMFRKMMQ